MSDTEKQGSKNDSAVKLMQDWVTQCGTLNTDLSSDFCKNEWGDGHDLNFGVEQAKALVGSKRKIVATCPIQASDSKNWHHPACDQLEESDRLIPSEWEGIPEIDQIINDFSWLNGGKQGP